MNSGGVWLRDNNNNKQLPTPVILPETFVEHKKTLLNTSCGTMKQSASSAIEECTRHRYTSSAFLLKSRTTIAPRYCMVPQRNPTNTNLMPEIRSAAVENRFFNGKFGISTPPPPTPNLSSSSSGVQPNNPDNGDNVMDVNTSHHSAYTHGMLRRRWNNFSQTGGGGGSSLNTPFASRSMPYKRFRDFNYSTGPINLSKNELDTSLYDSGKDLHYIDQCFQLNCVLDKGTFSEVYHAQSRSDGRYYAIKVVNLIQKHILMCKYNEVKILDHILPHSNIIHFYSAWREYDYMFIKTELCLDNFSNLLVIKRIDENELLIFLSHSLSGLQHIHSLDIVHMDIKSSNILLGLDGYYKIADFGLAALQSKNDKKNGGITEGDSRYMAVELLNNIVSPASDVFSLGMTLVEAIYNINLPVDGSLWHRLRQGFLPNRDFETVDYSEQLYTYTERMIAPDPNLRPTPQELFQWNQLSQAINSKSTYLETLKPQYEACIASRINLSDGSCSPNTSHSNNNNSNDILTCSTPVLFFPPTKKSRLDSTRSIDRTTDSVADDEYNSDAIELNFSE